MEKPGFPAPSWVALGQLAMHPSCWGVPGVGEKQAMGLTCGLVQGSELGSKLDEWSSGCFLPAGLDKLLDLLLFGFFCGGADHKLGI